MGRKINKTIPTSNSNEFEFDENFIYDNEKIKKKFFSYYKIEDINGIYLYKNNALSSARPKIESGYERVNFKDWSIVKLNNYLKEILNEIELIDSSIKNVNKILIEINYV